MRGIDGLIQLIIISEVEVERLLDIITMMIKTNLLVPMTDANQNFSKVVRLVDEEGLAVIMKNNKPRYVVVDFKEYDEIQAMREARIRKINETADKILADNMEAFKELAK